MDSIITVAVIVLIIATASLYVFHSKKKGRKCIGCPYADSCPSRLSGDGCGADKSK